MFLVLPENICKSTLAKFQCYMGFNVKIILNKILETLYKNLDLFFNEIILAPETFAQIVLIQTNI